MYDAFGLPIYPIIFQILMVLTFSIHIIFVNLTWASSFLAFYFDLKKEEKYKKLSFTLKRALPSLFSVAILMGIAPLLFIQTIYDYLWYSSNIFSGIYLILFLFALMIAFSFLYLYYLKENSPKWLGAVSFILISFAGIVIHVLNIQMLYMSKWGQFWHPSSFGKLNIFEIYRFLHFFFASFAIAGFFMLTNAWYLKKRNTDEEIVKFRSELGLKIFFIFTILQAISGIWWLVLVPGKFKFYFNHLTITSIVLFLVLLHFMLKALKNPLKYFYHISITLFVLIITMAANRESLRALFLKESGFSLKDYPLNIHFPSFLLFLITFLLAILATIFMLSVIFKLGLKKEEVEDTPFIKNLGSLSVIGLILWVLIVAGLGVIIYVKNL
ncbi:MAG: hypothetical protein WHV67_03800 [Thermoanaerobaculia bacterium]